MKARVVVAMVAGLVMAVPGCFISPVIPIGSGKSATQVQHEGLGKLFPAQLAAARKWPGEVRVAKLRVWADDEYRAQNMRWQHGFDEQLDYANQILVPMLGVRLEADYRAWDHHAPSATLMEHLQALAHDDPGDDVVWIVGLTSALSLVSATFDNLGVAYLGERHVVLRGHANLEERKAFERAFSDIGAEERENVLEARRRHKTTTVLIHELGHSLGALHEVERDRIMHPGYSHLAASISDRNRELMSITLEDRLKPEGARDPEGTARRLLAAIDIPWAGWDPSDRASFEERLRAQFGGRTGSAITGAVPAAVADQYRRAERQLAAGDHSEAAATLDALLAAYPAHVELRVLGCKIELARGGVKDARAIALCERAAGLSAEAGPAVEVAAALLEAGAVSAARGTLLAAEARIASLAPDKATTQWLVLAMQYKKLGAISWAEAALEKANLSGGADPGIATWITTSRVRYGLPRNGARWNLRPENEPDALAAIQEVMAATNADNFAVALKAAATAEKRWPALPGLLAARCDLEIRRGDVNAARRYCKRALEQGESSWALYLSGILEMRSGSPGATQAGIVRLRETIKLDPDLAQAWRSLAKALARSKATAEYDELRRDYEARFHQALP